MSLSVLLHLASFVGCHSASWPTGKISPTPTLQWKIVLNNILGIGGSLDSHDSTPNGAPPSTGLSVIGAGLPRTGTHSLKTALDRLGYRAYHMQNVAPEGHNQVWKALFESSQTSGSENSSYSGDFDLVLDSLLAAGYDATTDFPSCFLAVELAERFPDARVILSVRDSAETWADSYGNTVGVVHAQSVKEPLWTLTAERMGPFADFMDARFGMNIEYDQERRQTKESLARAYSYWIDYVKRNIEEDRLLVHNSKDGWEPLCQHLGVSSEECPSDPFPYTNTRTTWIVIVTIVYFLTDTWPYCLAVPGMVMLMLVIGALRCVRTWLVPRTLKEANTKIKSI